MNFNVENLEIEGVKLITPFCSEDERGYFLKSFERGVFGEWGLETDIHEDFESLSKKGVIRGLHFQTKNPQIKIVRVISGAVRDVVVDIRYDSKTFGQHIIIELNDENRRILWIPAGFAHGFEVVSEKAIMSYKCIGKYEPGFDTGIRYDDPNLGINWNTKLPILSLKDKQLMSFEEFKMKFCMDLKQ